MAVQTAKARCKVYAAKKSKDGPYGKYHSALFTLENGDEVWVNANADTPEAATLIRVKKSQSVTLVGVPKKDGNGLKWNLDQSSVPAVSGRAPAQDNAPEDGAPVIDPAAMIVLNEEMMGLVQVGISQRAALTAHAYRELDMHFAPRTDTETGEVIDLNKPPKAKQLQKMAVTIAIGFFRHGII